MQTVISGILEVSDCSVVTSGPVIRNILTREDGKNISSHLDPSTGRPAESGLVSVTVVGKEGKQLRCAFNSAVCDG